MYKTHLYHNAHVTYEFIYKQKWVNKEFLGSMQERYIQIRWTNLPTNCYEVLLRGFNKLIHHKKRCLTPSA